MTMPGRKYDAGSGYRYGFNGQEKSDEIFEGSTTALFWEYDSRIGRRWNVDPVVKVYESPYACFSNNPIINVDPHGDSDSTITTPGGGSEKIPGNATNITPSQSGTVAGTSTPTQNAPNSTESFVIGGKTFNARYNVNGEFTRFAYLAADGSLETYDFNNYQGTMSKIIEWWNSWNIVASGTATGSVGVQAEFKIGEKILNQELKGKIGGGFFVYEFGTIGAKYDKTGLDFIMKEGVQKIHNYVIFEGGGIINGNQIGAGYKYDYNYNFYVGYNGIQQDGSGSHDHAGYFFGKSYGNKNLDAMFKPLSNPFTPKLKTGLKTSGEKTFYGIDLSGSIKLLLGVEYSFKLGINK